MTVFVQDSCGCWAEVSICQDAHSSDPSDDLKHVARIGHHWMVCFPSWGAGFRPIGSDPPKARME
jgi:hypothetical protein